MEPLDRFFGDFKCQNVSKIVNEKRKLVEIEERAAKSNLIVPEVPSQENNKICTDNDLKMADSENKDRDLREINNEITQAMQHWKMVAAQKENEKLQLMRENNDLRYQLSVLRNAQLSGNRKLSTELQAASKEILSHLVKASDVVARMLDSTKLNMQDLEPKLPRWSSLNATPTADKVNRVTPLLIGGKHIQPVVSLSRTLESNNSGSNNSTNQTNESESARLPLPLHMLQDVFITLTRIDDERSVSNGETNVEQNMEEDGAESLTPDIERSEESPSAREDFEESNRGLEPVPEEEEVQTEHDDSSRSVENPLEGPSWLLDESSLDAMMAPRPVSVTVACEFTPTVRRRRRAAPPASPLAAAAPSPRRSPHRAPQLARRASNSGRILKVMVTKMRLSDDEDDSDEAVPPKKSKRIEKPAKRSNRDDQRANQTETPPKGPIFDEMQPKPQKIHRRIFPDTPKRQESSPAKRYSIDGLPICQLRDLNSSQRLMRFDAPSPKGSTDAHVIVLERRNEESEPCCSGVTRSRTLSRESSCEVHSNHNRSNHSNHNRSDHSDHNHDNNLVNHRNHSNVNDHRRKNSRDTPTSQLSDNSNSNHSNSNHSNSNHSNNDSRDHTTDTTESNHGNHLSVNCNSRPKKNRRNNKGSDSDSSSNSDLFSEGRTRRPRKAVIYKEKPLNRKLRR